MATTSRKRRAIVIFDTRFGSTERVARSLERGLRDAGLDTDCVNSKDLGPSSLTAYDLICVGAPTEVFSASKAIKEFLGGLHETLNGKYGYAFDTKIQWRLSGSAAKFIDRRLQDMGLQIIASHESAIVTSIRQNGQFADSKLVEGEEGRFEKIGFGVGRKLLEKREVVLA